jgi:nucleoside-diphosphate-sugar epimerase
MSTVAITGVSGHLGGALLSRLAADDDIERIVGIDVLEPPRRPKKLQFLRLDIRDPELPKALVGVDSVVHLAFILSAGDDERLMFDVNVGGLRNVLSAIEAVGASHLVYPSSAWVYGAHPDNDFPLTEGSPVRPCAGSLFAEHKEACEEEISLWGISHPGVVATVLRLALVFGAHADNPYSRLLESPFLIGVRGRVPSLCVLHEEDAAGALHFALSRRLSGVFNVCSDDTVERAQLLALAAKREITMPEGLLRGLVRRLHGIGLLDLSSAEVSYHLHSWVMSNERLRSEGWSPSFTSLEAIRATIEANRGYVSVGNVRASRATWRRALLLMAGGAVAGGALVRRLMRMRRRRGSG